MIKKLLLPALAAVMLAGCACPAKQQPAGEADAYPKLEATGEMTILAWHSILAKETTVERFKELRATGITHSYTGFPTADSMAAALDMAQLAGVKLLVSCPELKSDPEATVKRFMNHPAVAGYYLRDEPNTSEFPELAEWAKRIRATDGEHYCYLNLLPNYASLEMLQAESYRDYVSRFDKEVPLQLLSFDFYPIVDDTIRAGWYDNLEVFSDEARKAGKPFWAFALTTAHTPYPIPTLAQLRLQMYSNLAYGAQGLQYFTYWNPRDTTVWNFHHAPITVDGKRTDVYDKITEMNREIKALTGVFLGSEVLSVYHTGDVIPENTKPLETLPAKVKFLRTEGQGAIVSELRNGANKFLVIVNRDYKQRMKLEIGLDESVSRILKDGSIVPASLYSETMMVDPGDIMVYMYQLKYDEYSC